MASDDSCPKCGSRREPGALDCPFCGIVYARWRPAGAAGAPARAAVEPTWRASAASGASTSSSTLGSVAVAEAPAAVETLYGGDDDHNPYAPPRAQVGHPQAVAGQGGVWRKGNLLVMRKDAQLPGRCVRCNAMTHEPRLKRKLYWHPAGYYLFILVNLIIYAIIAMAVRKKAEVMVPLCPEHVAARKRARSIGWLIVLACPLLVVVGMMIDDKSGGSLGVGLVLFGFVGFWVALLVATMIGRVVVPTRIDEQSVWLKGAGPAYLAALPESPL